MEQAEFIIDFEKNSKDLCISTEIYLRILQKAIEQTRQDIVMWDAAVQTHDQEKIKSIAHRLKGDYANMRIEKLSDIAKEVNGMTISDESYSKISELVDLFKNYFSHLINQIESLEKP